MSREARGSLAAQACSRRADCSGPYGVQLGPDCHIQTTTGSAEAGAGETGWIGSRPSGFVAGADGADGATGAVAAGATGAGAAGAGEATAGAAVADVAATGALAVAAGVGGLCKDAGSLRFGAVAAVAVAG